MKKTIIGIGLVGSLLTIQAQALADEAKKFHKEGVRLFQEERYGEAAEAFREANRLKPSWKLYFNIGQCEAAAKRFGLALDAFEAYLVEGGDDVPDERREYVSSEIRRIQPLVGALEVDAENGQELLVDGFVRAVTPTNGPVRVASGKHDVSVRTDQGETVYQQTVNVAGGMTTTFAATANEDKNRDEQAAEADRSESETSQTYRGRSSKLKMGGWITLGTGAAVLIGGAVTGAMALGKNKELADNCPDSDACDGEFEDLGKSAENLALTTDIMLGVGGAAAVAGFVMLMISRKHGTEEDNFDVVSFAPVVGPGSAGLAITGRF